ncbi:MAG: alkaline phosphatase family protein [Planctomycetota bacterium]
MRKAVVLGIDGLHPTLVNQWLDNLPNLKKLQKGGVWGALESTLPPGPPHAWTSSHCGKNPGSFGFWDYSHRDKFSYSINKMVDSVVVESRVRCLYNMLSKMGEKIAIINVPLTWPLPKIPGGYCISNHMSAENDFTWPENLYKEISGLFKEYISQVPEAFGKHREINKEKVLEKIYLMDTQWFTLVKHFFQEKKCDYVFAVLDGTALVSHLFLRNSDFKHRYYEQNTHFSDTLFNYYKWIDKKIGEVSKILDEDSVLFVYSAYSIQRLNGQINLNEWLIKNGYMTLHEYPSEPLPFNDLNVDWSKTKCWSVGNSGLIFINQKGRESKGIVDPDNYEILLDELSAGIKLICEDNSNALNTRVLKRDDIFFGNWVEYGPDLLVNISDGKWNTNEKVGYGIGKIHHLDTLKDSIGEGFGHKGYFCISGSDFPPAGELHDISLLNLAPTIIDALNLREPYDVIPYEMEEHSILTILNYREEIDTHDKEANVRSRLEALGY